jgi:hypothetical protein
MRCTPRQLIAFGTALLFLLVQGVVAPSAAGLILCVGCDEGGVSVVAGQEPNVAPACCTQSYPEVETGWLQDQETDCACIAVRVPSHPYTAGAPVIVAQAALAVLSPAVGATACVMADPGLAPSDRGADLPVPWSLRPSLRATVLTL